MLHKDYGNEDSAHHKTMKPQIPGNNKERNAMEKDEYISSLLYKYLDGGTTNGEEEALRKYFSDPENYIPDEWRPYKALFEYVSSEREKAMDKAAKKNKPRRRVRLYALAAAASVAILLAITLPDMSRPDNYAVIDGKVYTNRKTVEKEALNALKMVSADEDDSFDALKTMSN